MANNTRGARLTIVALALVVASATVPSQERDPAVGAITGEMVVRSPDNRTIGKLEATVSYSLPAQAGDTGIRFTPSDRSTTVSASAEFTAVRQSEAFGAVTALMLALTGRQGNDRTSLRLSNVRVEGDLGALRGHVDAIIGWWDEQATIAVPDYLSPVLSSTHIGKLVFNVWGTEVGGRVVMRNQSGGTTFHDFPSPSALAFLAPITNTPLQNDFSFTVVTPAGTVVQAELVIEALPDGTFDVRGLASQWISGGTFTVEGIGSAKFVPPGS